MKKKKIALIMLAIVIVIIVVIIVINVNNKEEKTIENTEEMLINENGEKYVEILEDGSKINTSSKLSENRKIKGMTLTDIKLIYENNVTILQAKVINETNKDIKLTPVVIKLFDDQGNELQELEGLISPVKAGESVLFTALASADYANSYDFTITIK